VSLQDGGVIGSYSNNGGTSCAPAGVKPNLGVGVIIQVEAEKEADGLAQLG
jgi:hypothetical protein